MQRYHTGSCTSAVNNSVVGGSSTRDSRAESSSLSSNFPLNPRRPLQPTVYKIRCEKESLNSRLGPPDFHPPTPNCPEETLTKEYVQSGYRETVEGLEEAREISLTQVHNFTKPAIIKCKEAIRKYHRAINESRAQKRKAGQVYGVPLSGNLLSKPGIFPEQKPCGEDFRKKWLEGLSQPHKRLRTLADHVPHGYRRKSLIEVLIRNNVPLLRATWFIKVSYLNQVRPGTSSISSGVPDKIQLSRSEQWTRDIIEYLQYLLDEFVSRNNSHSNLHIRERSHVGYAGSLQNKTDSMSATVDGEEPSLHFKWWYLVRIIHWHLTERLLLPSLIIDWVLNQLQEKDLLAILQLLLPIIYGVLQTVVLSQTYVRSLVRIAIHFIQQPSPGGSDLVDNSRRAYTMSALVEMLRYLILAVPDTFVGLDCFPLPSCVVSNEVNGGSFLSRVAQESGKIKVGPVESDCMLGEKGHDFQGHSLSIGCVVSSIQKRADKLARAATPGHPGRNAAKAVQALDRALMLGDVRGAYTCMFEDLYDGIVDEKWITDVSPCLRSSLKWIGAVSLSLVSSIFFVCEWATCDFRDFRSTPPHGLKFTGRRDFSQVYIAIRLFELKMRQVRGSLRCKSDIITGANVSGKGPGENKDSGRTTGNAFEYELKSIGFKRKARLSEIFHSPGPLHDTFVCWIDQHDTYSAEGFKRLQLLVIELTRAGIFYPQAYVRQLIVSGITDRNDSPADLERRKRHHKILKQLPGPYVRDALEEAQITDNSVLTEAMSVYSNERRLLLRELLNQPKGKMSANRSLEKNRGHLSSGRNGLSSISVDNWKTFSLPSNSLSGKKMNRVTEIEELKVSISALLLFPNSCSAPTVNELDESKVGIKKSTGSTDNRNDQAETIAGCEECRRVKRQKLSEEKNTYIQSQSPNPFDDEDIWWVRKGLKSLESSRPDPPVKQVKQASRGRQKVVRKTQSLAQLAASRIEGSQGASTSHVCESRISCSRHSNSNDSDASKLLDGKAAHLVDIGSIGKSLKQLRMVEQRAIVVWLISLVRELIEKTGKTTEAAVKVGQTGRPFPAVEELGSAQWKLGEDELSAILYMMDATNELTSAAKFLIWLLPKVSTSTNSTVHGGRNVMMVPKIVENQVCAVGEAFILSSLRRYENILAAADLIPETLSATMHRAAALLASNGRVSGSSSLVFARHLFKKYGHITRVVEWVKNFKVTFDKRLASELESGRSADGEFGFPLGVPAGVEDFDDFLRQKISGARVSRVGVSMRDTVQRCVDDAFHSFYGKDRKPFSAATAKSPILEKLDDGHQIAQQMVMGLLGCMRQTGGAAQEGDPALVSFAISAIVCNIGQVIAKIPDLTGNVNSPTFQPATGLKFARHMLHIHLTCLWLLKDELGERQSRVFEIALATEASSALSQVFSPTKASRSQYQPSPEAHDSNGNLSSDIPNNSTKPILGRAAKITGAVSALVVGAVLQGISTLERMVSVFRLKEGLDMIQFVRSMRTNSNGSARSIGALKVDTTVEVSVHWFRVLVGNCRSVSDGFVVELLGEACIVALSRMQRLLPLSLVFPPAYSIFGYLIWKRFILTASATTRDDIHQLYQSLNLSIADAIKHLPFRDICLRDSGSFYDLVTSDATDSEFAAMLDSSGSDMHAKANAIVPLRARLFLNAIIECKMPPGLFPQDDGNRMSGHGELKVLQEENGKKNLDKLVHILDTLQPAKFHWQWLELRLLLNEQALIDKLEARDTSLVEVLRSLSPNHDKAAASENESNFIEIILTRLLVRPDAASLYSEVVHLLGRSLEDSMLLQAKWLLGGPDVLFGRKSIRQRLINKSESKGLSTKAQFWKPWGWCLSNVDHSTNKGVKRKFEVTSIEEGEVVDEGTDSKRHIKGSPQVLDVEAFIVSQQHVTEKALIELVLPCIDQSSDDSRITFASDLIKQMNNIELQINAITRGASKQPGTVSSGIEGPTTKGNSRKGMRGGSPGLTRRPAAQVDTVLPSPSALRASMSLRLQLLLRLLPAISADREPSGRNMRHMLASVVLRLLGSRVVYEDADQSNPLSRFSLKRQVESMMEATSASIDLSGESLFDRFLLVLHGMLSSCQPGWLRLRSLSGSGPKSSAETSRDWFVFDREVAETLQNDLDRMVLPDAIRWRIQTAMPFVFPSSRLSVSCQPPTVPPLALTSLQPSIIVSGIHPGNSNMSLRSSVSSLRSASNGPGKVKPLTMPQQQQLQQEVDMEIDPWTLLEDGAGSGPSSSNTAVIGGSDNANLKAASWLKGAVRVRRTDLTYIGAVDEDS